MPCPRSTVLTSSRLFPPPALALPPPSPCASPKSATLHTQPSVTSRFAVLRSRCSTGEGACACSAAMADTAPLSRSKRRHSGSPTRMAGEEEEEGPAARPPLAVLLLLLLLLLLLMASGTPRGKRFSTARSEPRLQYSISSARQPGSRHTPIRRTMFSWFILQDE